MERVSSEFSSNRCELCVAAPSSFTKEYSRCVAIWSRSSRECEEIYPECNYKKDAVQHQYVEDHPRRGTAFYQDNASSVTSSAIARVSTSVLHCIKTVIVTSIQASDYHHVILQLDRLALTQENPFTKCAMLLGCGLAYYKLGRCQEAVLKFEELIKVCRSDASLRGTCSLAYCYLGDIACTMNSHEEASSFYEQAVFFHCGDSLGDLFLVSMPSVTHISTKCGQALRKASKIMQAMSAFNKAITMAMDKKEEMLARGSLGNMLQSLGNHHEAIDEYNVTIRIAEELGDYVSLGWYHGNIGNAYLGKGDRDKAIHHLTRCLDLTLVHEITPQAISRAYNNLGMAYQALGELDKAQEHYVLALDQATFGQDAPGQARAHGNLGNVNMLKKEYDKAHQSYTESLNLCDDRSLKCTAHHNRGCCLYEMAEEKRSKLSPTMPLSDQIQKLYEDGTKDFKEVVQYHEETLSSIKGSPKGLSLSVSLFDANSSTFQRLVDCLYSLGMTEQALMVAEQCRSRTLGELLLRKSAHPLTTPISYEEMCTIVQSQHCMVVYLAYTGSRLIMWAFNPTSVKVNMASIHIDINKDLLGGKTLDYHLRCDLPGAIAHHDNELFGSLDYGERSPLHQLFEIIGKPLIELLRTVSTEKESHDIILIPDSYTSLPIAAFCDHTLPSFLGDQFTFRIMPSLLTMGLIVHDSPQGVELVGLGRADKGRTSDQFCVIGDPNIPVFTHKGEEVSLGRLPHATKEAQWVAHILSTTATLGNDATKHSVMRRLQTAKVIHLATHGGASDGFLAFAGGHGSTPVEAKEVLLFPHEVEQLVISPVLVVLSCCNSARGRVSADGVISMARAFLLAGAQSILTTLWQVPDESAGVFMKFFYQYLIDGLTSAQALQRAMHSVRFIKKYAKYVHWGAYQLIGRDIRFARLQREGDTLSNFSGNSQLDILTALESTLLVNPHPHQDCTHQEHTPVQILHGSPDMDPSECVLSFVYRHHDQFKAIFYIQGIFDELLQEAELSVKELIPRIAPDDKVLVVLDGVEKLSRLPVDLLLLLKRSNTSIVIVHTSSAPPTSIADEIDTLLVRGCGIHLVMPLNHTHCTERMVYAVLSRTNLIPMNQEQEVMSLLCDFTCGSPVLADIASEVMCTFCENCDNPIQGLMTEVLQPLGSSVKEQGLTAYMDVMIRALKLNVVEYTALCSLAMYGPCPIPAPILTNAIKIILSSLPGCKYTTDHVVQHLLKRRLVKSHPSIVMMSSVDSANRLYCVPHLIIDATLYGMDDKELVLAAGIAHKAIINSTMVSSCYSVALSKALLQTALNFMPTSGHAYLDVFTELCRPIVRKTVPLDLDCTIGPKHCTIGPKDCTIGPRPYHWA